jgi:hypothetical protein
MTPQIPCCANFPLKQGKKPPTLAGEPWSSGRLSRILDCQLHGVAAAPTVAPRMAG